LDKPSLPLHEWLAVASILALMAAFMAITTIQRNHYSPSPHNLNEIQEIEVSIKGAVEKPGTYRVQQGTLLKELLQQAIPMENSNLSRLKLERPLRDGQAIHVPKKRQSRQNRSTFINNKDMPCKTQPTPS